MRANVNLLTAASERSVAASVTGYENATAAHIAGDWGVHNQVLFYATPFSEFASGHTITNGYLLRVLLTGTNGDGTGDGAFTVPVVVPGIAVNVGGAPVIIRQPLATAAFVGGIVNLTVKAISGSAQTYQWRKNGTDITGATSSALVLANIQTSDQAAYDVVITNEFGSTTSSAANVTVTVPDPTVSISNDGCFTGDTLITLADGSRRPIKDIKAGDRVRSYLISGLNTASDDAWKTWTTTSLNMQPTISTVKEVFKQRTATYYRILDLKVTFEHPLLSRRNGVWAFRQVARLQVGDFLWRDGIALPIDNIFQVTEEVETYNMNVEEADVYIASGFCAHNILFAFFKGLF